MIEQKAENSREHSGDDPGEQLKPNRQRKYLPACGILRTGLREAGFRIEMDDFGSGYSSLNMLSTLPIDVLKLDMVFIRNAFSAKGNTRMLEITLDISRYLSVPMIAEGVETEEQMLALKKMGCDIAQGYFFSKPVPPEEFLPFLTK